LFICPIGINSLKTFALIFLAALAAHAQSINFSTLAGSPGPGGSDGEGASAQFYQPGGAAVDSSGNVYVADSGNNTIRKITPAGVTITIAGTAGLSGSADGLGTNALFNHPAGLAVDGSGNVYVADFGNSTIRRITPAGSVITFAGAAGQAGNVNATGTNALFNQPEGVAVDSSNNVYVADYGNNIIRKITPAAVVTTFAGTANSFYQPGGVAVDGAGNVYVADTANNVIRKITPAGAVTILAGTTNSFGSLDGPEANALFYQPSAIAVDSAADLYVADYVNNTIRMITAAGTVSTLAGLPGNYGSMDGTGTNARFWGPLGIAVDGASNLYVADSGNNTVRKITAGTVSTLAGSPSASYVDGTGTLARFNSPQSAAADQSGNIYVADSQNNSVRKVTTTGVVSTLAQFFGPQGVAVDGSGKIYVSDTGNNRIQKISSGGSVSTLAGAPATYFNHPQGLALDGAGNLDVADSWNNTIRQITPGGTVNTLAGVMGKPGSADSSGGTVLFNEPAGLAIDGANNIYVTDFNNHTVRKISAAGVTTTLAGTAGIWGYVDATGTNAAFNGPMGIALDASGNLYVADSGNHAIRKLSPSGSSWVVTTVALSSAPAGMAINGGAYYVADSVNNNLLFNGLLSPVIVIQPQSLTTFNGATVTFSVTASGTLPLSYFWQSNGASFGPGINAFSATQAGNYSVIVSNLAGVALSDVVTLTLTNASPGSFQTIAVLPDGSVELELTGATPGAGYAVQASTDLINWITLTTVTNTGPDFEYIDTTAADFPDRFYRLNP
jgi:sugar lactone lactonase YvrE